MAKIYVHQYKREEGKLPFQIDEYLCDSFKEIFPKIKARLTKSLNGLSSLVYQVPLLGGLNEVEVSQISYGENRNIIYTDLRTEGLFGDKIHRKLETILDAFKLVEDQSKRATITLPQTEIIKRNSTIFPLIEAEKNARIVVEAIKKNKLESISIVVKNPYEGEYMKLEAMSEAVKAGLNLNVSYDSKTNHLSFRLNKN